MAVALQRTRTCQCAQSKNRYKHKCPCHEALARQTRTAQVDPHTAVDVHAEQGWVRWEELLQPLHAEAPLRQDRQHLRRDALKKTLCIVAPRSPHKCADVADLERRCHLFAVLVASTRFVAKRFAPLSTCGLKRADRRQARVTWTCMLLAIRMIAEVFALRAAARRCRRRCSTKRTALMSSNPRPHTCPCS